MSPARRIVGQVAAALILWAAVALVLAYLAAPRGEGEWYAGLSIVAIAAWLLLRRRLRYHGAQSKRDAQWPSA